MNVSHVILKVSNLNEAVEYYREHGFSVEYGKNKNPLNALIYFSEGPYIEILPGTGMPVVFKKNFRLLGKAGLVQRLDHYDNSDNGSAGIGFRCLRINACCDKLLGKEAMSHRLFRPLLGLRRSGVKNNLHPS